MAEATDANIWSMSSVVQMAQAVVALSSGAQLVQETGSKRARRVSARRTSPDVNDLDVTLFTEDGAPPAGPLL